MSKIPIIDLFAGPGGLSEGFEAYRDHGRKVFRCALSIEKDKLAHETLQLRAFFRQFKNAPNAYYAHLRGELALTELYKQYSKQWRVAARVAVQLNLARRNSLRTQALVSNALRGQRKKWVLIGGPPCQAYSVIGRSRMRGADSGEFETDGRHFLYQEYLRILTQLKPPVFVMENVKGLLSSSVSGIEMFDRILKDFSEAGYSIHSFVTGGYGNTLEPGDFVIESEQYDIPQARHRVILLGVRKRLERGERVLEKKTRLVTIHAAIGDLPHIRSRLPKGSEDTFDTWKNELCKLRSTVWGNGILRGFPFKERQRFCELSAGSKFVAAETYPHHPSSWLERHRTWFIDPRIGGITLHESRRHMATDLRRYLFAAHYAHFHKKSPKLADFPSWLRPAHKNVKEGVDGTMFSDRFRVQTKRKPATTVVSHISKDGHYYIHYDPTQCRSLTVREVARLQTFPDNYFFEGPRTSQYHQVGNAVPPLLAQQLAAIVYEILDQI